MNISVTVSISRSRSNSIKPSCFCVIFLRDLGYARRSNNLGDVPDIENPLNRKERFIIDFAYIVISERDEIAEIDDKIQEV